MKRLQHLLVIVNEEAVEVAQRADKALRFGVTEIEPGKAFDNFTRICHEYSDLVAALEMLCDELKSAVPLSHYERVVAKKAKVERFLQYSRQCGTLED